MPSFVMILKLLAGSAMRPMLSRRIPSTSDRSASAALFHDTELARIGIALAGQRQHPAFVDVAMISALGRGVPTGCEARIAPCCCASARDNGTSVPHAVLILYFFANS